MESGRETIYVVDGVISNTFPNIPQERIASIDVLKDASATAIYGSGASNGAVVIKTLNTNNYSEVPAFVKTRFESVAEYEIPGSHNIESNGKTNSVIFKESGLMAEYEFQAVPKLSQYMYLIAKVFDWNNYDLLEGDANIYLENAYIGTSHINPQQFSDTMEISFGIDNALDIKYKIIPEFTQTQILSSNKKETRAYKIVVRNNKETAVVTRIEGQVPVSTIHKIQVILMESTCAVLNKEDGSLTWQLSLEPGETKELIVKYMIKYPVGKQLNS